MTSDQYFEAIEVVLKKIRVTQSEQIKKAAQVMADSIAQGGVVHMFGSGHSVIPVLDIFPRYGSYPGFHPLLDPRLMWFNIIGPGGVQELLWLERQEGYAEILLKRNKINDKDVMLVFSHGGINAVPVEMALGAKRLGLFVVAVTSMENQQKVSTTHQGNRLCDIADITIDNCVPAEDALVKIDGQREPVAAGSTIAIVAISMALVAEIAKILIDKKMSLKVFVSPNVGEIPKTHNEEVFEAYSKMMREKDG
ncbi:MAG: SIS domain-containing protein [Candidatus Heimdallarchaeota archaeon]|nr:MAG: SIS domain-containing protein [Candidatus Heimdallarchaeota archaeon]